MSERRHRIDISNTARESRAAVTRCVQELTWTEETRKLDPNAELVWIDRALPVKKFYLQRLGANRRTYQRANRFFGMDSVVTKCSLAQSMDSLQALQSLSDRPTTEKVEQQVIRTNGFVMEGNTSSHSAEQYLPRSWCLPQDIDSFKNTTTSSSATCWYIAKPDRGRCGRGIALFSDRAKVMSAFLAGDLSEVGDEGEQQKKQMKQMKETQLPIMPLPVVVQEYIPDPLLYRDTECKFDLRVYVIIKSLSPLDVYVFDEALVRVASTPYEAPTETNCATATMHLTNSHINSTVQGDDGSGRGDLNKKEKKEGVEKASAPVLKHCMTDTLEWVSKKYNVPADEIWTRVKRAVATSIVAVYPLAALTHATCFAPNSEEHFSRCFQLLGIDILLDSKLQPWILEINNSPSLNLSTEADIAIKVPLVKSMLEEVFERRKEDEEESKKDEESKESKKEKSVIPRFQKLDVTTAVTCKCEGKEEEMPAVVLQASILHVFLKICGWKESSGRPVKSAMPSKDVCGKLMKNGISLPSRQELSLNRFTRWVTERAAGESSSIMIVLQSIEEAFL